MKLRSACLLHGTVYVFVPVSSATHTLATATFAAHLTTLTFYFSKMLVHSIVTSRNAARLYQC